MTANPLNAYNGEAWVAVAEQPNGTGRWPEHDANVPRPASWRPFPVRHLPDAVRHFVIDGAKSMGCDETYFAIPALAVIAGAVGNACRIQIKADWTEPLIVWTAVVAQSGTVKSPALDMVLRATNRRQRELLRNHRSRLDDHEGAMQRYAAAMDKWKRNGSGDVPSKPAEPPLPRVICSDPTIESLRPILRDNPKGILMARDELAGWLGGMNQYKQQRGSDVSAWLEMYAGNAVSCDRRSDGFTYIARAAVSVTGTIQPATLERAIDAALVENGLASRLFMAAPPAHVPGWCSSAVSEAVEGRFGRMLGRLYDLTPDVDENADICPGLIKLSPAALLAFITWVNRHAEMIRGLEDGPTRYALAKLKGGAARLAGIVHFARWADGEELGGELDDHSMAAGIAFAEWFAHEGGRIYGTWTETEEERDRRKLVELIERRGGSVTARELQGAARRFKTADQAKAALQALADAGLGALRYGPIGRTGGRPQQRFYLSGASTTPAPDPAGDGIASACTHKESEPGGQGRDANSATIR